MKLLLLLPNITVLAISVYNVMHGSGTQNQLIFPVLIIHFIVMAMCITIIALILKSMFKVQPVQQQQPVLIPVEYNEQPYKEVKLRKV